MSGGPGAGQHGPAARRGRLLRRLQSLGLDGILVTDLVNVRYLTGFTGSAAALLVTGGGDPVLATDGRYEEQAAAQTAGLEILVNPPPGWPAQRLAATEVLGVEGHVLPWTRVLELEAELDGRVVDAGRLVESLRVVKEPEEIAAMERAAGIADAAFTALLDDLAPGLTELEVARRLERAMVDLGAAERAFPSIVASGPNSAVPHHRPTARAIAAGEMIKLDFGALVDGYHSDMTRMVVCGEPAPELLRVFVAVRAAQAAGVVAAIDGASTAAVDRACREVLETAGLGRRFVHGTGHGVGLQIHEDPFLRPDRPGGPAAPGPVATLAARMVITVEPGAYLPGVGGVRIEDTLVIEAEGSAGRILTRTPHDLVVL